MCCQEEHLHFQEKLRGLEKILGRMRMNPVFPDHLENICPTVLVVLHT